MFVLHYAKLCNKGTYILKLMVLRHDGASILYKHTLLYYNIEEYLTRNKKSTSINFHRVIHVYKKKDTSEKFLETVRYSHNVKYLNEYKSIKFTYI